MENEIAKKYRLCSNCSDRILSGGCDGKCKEYWKYVGATEQKTIDDKVTYKQGFNDAIKKACNVFCHTGCPHKTDSYNCLNNKCDTWKIFKRMMEEQL